MITYEDFERIELRSGTIIMVEEFPKAKKPAYKVWVDFGDKIGVLQTSAQITVNYKSGDLVGKQIVGCINLGEKNIAGFISQFLLLGFSDADGAIILTTIDKKIHNGQKMY